MNKLFKSQLLNKLAMKTSLKKAESVAKNNVTNITKEAVIYEDVKKSLEEKGYKEQNKPVYDGSIKIPGALPGVAVVCPSNPIINGKYNVFFQIRSGNAPASAGVNTIIVIAEAGGVASKENTEAFGNKDWINKQLGIIQTALSKKFGNVSLGKLGLGSFSGGYGAVGKILQDPEMQSKVNSVVILDGIHAGERGKPDPKKMQVWLDYAKKAKDDPTKKFVFLYTAVDPGTYASTSDSANYLIDNLEAEKSPPEKGKSYAGVVPSSVANSGGFSAIQLYERKSDKPGYGYEYYADNRPGSMGHQHVQAAKALPEVWRDYLSSWNEG